MSHCNQEIIFLNISYLKLPSKHKFNEVYNAFESAR